MFPIYMHAIFGQTGPAVLRADCLCAVLQAVLLVLLPSVVLGWTSLGAWHGLYKYGFGIFGAAAA